jgi:hypothetical protein
MKRHLIFIFCTITYLAVSSANGTEDSAGTVSANFLKLPAEVRGIGMGEAVTAVTHGPVSVFQNPAGLSKEEFACASFMHASWVESIDYNVISVASTWRWPGVIAFGTQYLRYGNIESLDNTGGQAGNLSPKDVSLNLGWGISLDDSLSLGIAGKYIHSKLDSSDSTAALDAGFQKKSENLLFGAVLHNIGGGRLKFNKDDCPIPLMLKTGIGISHGKNLLLAFDLGWPKSSEPFLAAGMEYLIELGKNSKLYARGGYNTISTDTGETNGFSAGFGLGINDWNFDYAFKTLGVLGNTHHISVGFKWNRFLALP